MGLESATFVQDLDVLNPVSTDKKTQGDDHLRLIKNALKNTFLRATKAWALPGGVAKAASYTVLSSDQNLTIRCDTSGGAVTLTLPTLGSSDGGWVAFVVKENAGLNPVFLQPASGTINGFSKVRRTGIGQITAVLWTGTAWVASRPNGVPIGTILDWSTAAAPLGHLLCSGAAFSAADYVELNAVIGASATPDLRGFVLAGLDNIGGSAAGRLTLANAGFDTTVMFGAGSTEAFQIAQANLPSTFAPQAVAVTVNDTRIWRGLQASVQVAAASAYGFPGTTGVDLSYNQLIQVTGTISASGQLNSLGGSGTGITRVQPTAVVNKIIVAE